MRYFSKFHGGPRAAVFYGAYKIAIAEFITFRAGMWVSAQKPALAWSNFYFPPKLRVARMNQTLSDAESMQTCTKCGGHFPGAGVENNGKVYCCDKCAQAGRHKLHELIGMAPKLISVVGIGAVAGFLLGSNWK